MTPAVPSELPRFSLVTVLRAEAGTAFEETARSVLAQKLAGWEWVVVVDPDAVVPEVLAELAAADPRVRLLPPGDEVVSAARGEFVAFLGQDDVLTSNALKQLSAALGTRADVAYSDHDLITADGRIHSPHRKPDWAPERLRHRLYTGRLTALRRTLVAEVGGLPPGSASTREHDLVLRVTERAREVVHVPSVLYHLRQDEAPTDVGPEAWDAGVRAVQDHLDRIELPARAERGRTPGRYHLVREPDLTTPVSVVIPTIGSGGLFWGRQRRLVVEAVRSVRARSRHRDLEFVVVHDTATPPEALAALRGLPGVRLRLVEFTQPFNFSAKCNLGALHASGEVIVFLNDDVEAESDGVIEQLIAPLREDGVGATGPKLLFPDTRIQHAGVSYGDGNIAHSYYRHPNAGGPDGDLWINREATALTGACLAVRREVFEEVGGFSEQLPVNYNDVDLCLKIARTGRRLLWLHDVVLFHFESVSRSPVVADWERRLVERRWGAVRIVRDRHGSSVGT